MKYHALFVIFEKQQNCKISPAEQGEMPADWREANVTAIFKKGNTYEPSN